MATREKQPTWLFLGEPPWKTGTRLL